MGPTLLWKQHAKWRTRKSISVEGMTCTSCSLISTHSTPSLRDSGAIIGASQIYETLLRTGKTKKTCTACNRHLNTEEMVVFENYASVPCLPMNSTLMNLAPTSSKSK
jgi:hypothetical protein